MVPSSRCSVRNTTVRMKLGSFKKGSAINNTPAAGCVIMLKGHDLLKIMHNNLMPLFLIYGSIFLQTRFFHHLALSEAHFSYNSGLNYLITFRYYLYTGELVK